MNNLEKEFVPYEQALELKELGFNEPCLSYFDVREEQQLGNFDFTEINDSYIKSKSALTPLYQQAFRWFREKHGWVAEIHGSPQHNHFYANLLLQAKGEVGNSKICDTYEEAELACLKKLIEIIKDKKL